MRPRFVKVIADKKYGESLGVHIIGPAAELINEASTITEITVEENACSSTVTQPSQKWCGEALRMPSWLRSPPKKK